MREVKNKSFLLKPPKFVCDQEMKGVPEPFPYKQAFNLVIVGKPGSGKSSLAVSLITGKKKGELVYRKKFNHIIIMCPQGSLNSLKKNPFESIDYEDIYHSFDLTNLYDIYGKIEEWSDQDENTLIYIDDLASELKSGGKELENLYKRIAYNRRHLRCSIINCVQRFTSIPKGIRQMTTDLIFFKCSKNENVIMYDELLDIPKEKYRELCEFCFRNKHDTVMVKLNDNQYFRNFNEIKGFIDDKDIFI